MNKFLMITGEMFTYLPGGNIMPLAGLVIGFSYGLYRYIRSFQYLYYYYIEHGTVLFWMDDGYLDMNKISQKYRLNEHYRNFGYVGGILSCALFTLAGTIIGSLWPLAAVIGVLAIPYFALRHIAKEKRAKAVFEQTLQGSKND